MSFSTSKNTIANLTTLTTERVKAIIAMNRAGEKPESLIGEDDERPAAEPTYRSEEDSIDRFDNKGRRNKRNKRNRNRQNVEQGAIKEPVAKEGNESVEPTAAKETKREGGKERTERPEHVEHRERPRRHERTEKPERPERTDKPESVSEGEQSAERSERPNRNHRGRNHRGRNNHRQEGRHSQPQPKDDNNN
jgi:hypothetical protein